MLFPALIRKASCRRANIVCGLDSGEKRSLRFHDALKPEDGALIRNFCCRVLRTEQTLFTRVSSAAALALLFLCAKLPVSSVYKMISVSSKSQMKTRSREVSGDGDGFGARRPRPRVDLIGPKESGSVRRTSLVTSHSLGDHSNQKGRSCGSPFFAAIRCLRLLNPRKGDQTHSLRTWLNDAVRRYACRRNGSRVPGSDSSMTWTHLSSRRPDCFRSTSLPLVDSCCPRNAGIESSSRLWTRGSAPDTSGH